MSAVRDEDIRAIVAETLVEQQRQQRDDIDAVVFRAIATILTSSESRKKIEKSFGPISSIFDVGARASSKPKAILSRP